MKNIFYIIIISLVYSIPNYGQISFKGCTGDFGNSNYTFTKTGTNNLGGQERNIFELVPVDWTTDASCPAGVCEARIIYTGTQWEIQLDNASSPCGNGVTPQYGCVEYHNDTDSYPNPPDLTLGTWVGDATFCSDPIETLSGDVQDFIDSPSNTAPTIAVADFNYTAGQSNGDPVLIDGSASASDTEGNWDGGSLTVQITTNNEANDEISINETNTSLSGSSVQDGATTFGTISESSGTVNDGVVTNGDLLTITFNSNATDARVQALVRDIAYRSTSSTPSTSTRTVAFILSDDTQGTTDNVSINITAAPEIALSANSNNIADGANLAATSTTNGTDFANVCVDGGSATITYTITNSGGANLTLDGTSPNFVVLSGGNAGDFSVSTQPSSTTVTPSSTTTFVITFNPTASGQRSTTVSIANNDSDENPFDFVIEGTGIASPNAAFTAPADLCVDAGVQAGLGGGTPTGGVYSGVGVTDDGNGMTYSFNPAAAGTGTHTLTYTVTVSGCADSASDDIEVFALPTVSFTAPADLCVDAGNQAGLGGGTPTGGVYSGTGVTDDNNGSTYSFDPAAAGAGTHTITYTFTDGSGCSSSASDDVEVFALPTVTFTAPADLCIDAGVQSGLGGGTPTGGVYSGSGVTDDGNGMTYSFDPAAAGAGTHSLTYTVTANSCSDSATDAIEVFALPSVSFTAPADLCIDAGVQAGLGGGTPTGGVYSGVGVTDDGNGMTYSFDPAAAGAGTHTLTYTVTVSGCADSASDDIEVFALPTVTFTAPADLCIDAGVQTGLGGGTPTGGAYSGTGVTDDGNGMTYSFDPAAAGAGTHTITYTFTDSNGCSGSASDAIEVFALPSVSFTAPADLCIDAGVQAGLGGGTPTGGAYSGTGVTDDGNGMTYSFDPAAAGVGTHTITYTFTDSNGCSGSASDAIEVFALPTVTFTAPADLCIDAGVQAGLGGGTPTGGVYSGTGVTDDGNGMTYSFDPAAAGAGTHTITYTFTDSNGCSGSASDAIEVFALPSVTFTALADLCINDGVQAGLGGGTPTGGVYSGTGVTDDNNGMTYSFDPAAAGAGTHTITYTFIDSNGCSDSASDNVQVFAPPNASFTAPADLCLNTGNQTGLGGGTPTGGIYSGPSVTDDGNGMTYSFDPAAAGVGTHTLTYTVGATGCTDSASDDIEVFALPTVTFTAPADLCIDAGVQAGLGGGTPTGGAYSGTGVTDDNNGSTYSFDPAAAGAGTHTITYTFTDSNGCSGSASDDIEVFSVPEVTSIVRADGNPTDAASVDFTVTFSESITGMGTGDFVIDATGITGASVTGVSGSGATYTVTVDTGSGNGTLSIDFDADASGGVTNGNCVSATDFTNGEEYDICGCSPTCSPLLTAAGIYTATKSETDAAGYTHFCDASGNLLLSVQIPAGGSIQNNAVSLQIGNPLVIFENQWCGGSNTSGCFVKNPLGSPLLQRQWHIDETQTSGFGFALFNVTYYFTDAEFTALQTSATNNGATALSSFTDVQLYKISDWGGVYGKFPAPSSIANWWNATPIKYVGLGNSPSMVGWQDANYSGVTPGFGATFKINSMKGGGGSGGVFNN